MSLRVCQLVLQSLRFGLWGRGRGLGLVFGGVVLRSWVQPYCCITQTLLCCDEFIRGGFVFLPRGGQLALQSFRFGLRGDGRGIELVFWGVGLRSWAQPYRCITRSHFGCREVLQSGFVCCLHRFQFVLQSFLVNLWSVSRGALDNMGSGSGVSVHWIWMVPTDSSQVRWLQLASSG